MAGVTMSEVKRRLRTLVETDGYTPRQAVHQLIRDGQGAAYAWRAAEELYPDAIDAS